MEYFAASIIALIIWSVLFAVRKDLRREMVLMSLLSTPPALFEILYVPSYWQPVTLFDIPIGVEGFFYSFSIGGVAAVSYELFARKRLKKIVHYSNKTPTIAVLLLVLPVALLVSHIFAVNIQIGMYAGLILGVGVALFLRKDLIPAAFYGALIFGTIYAYAVLFWSAMFPHTASWFTVAGLPRLFVFHASLYEIVFGFLFGAYWGNMYELLFGYKYRSV